MLEKLTIYTDGGCKNNPGPAAIGVIIQDGAGTTLETISRHIGMGTNNKAEYQALIAGLERALELKAQEVEIRSDSLLMVEQMNGRYRVKNAELAPLFQKAQELSRRLKKFSIIHIPREQNHHADRMAFKALNGDKDA
jgi:ribonuclease HI